MNSLTSVSLNPPLILVCFNRNTRTEMAVQAEGSFAVCFLREDQGELSNRFARRGEDHFKGLEVHLEGGVPILPNCLGHLVCRVTNIYAEGDHSIVIGSVVGANLGSGTPLLFFRGKYHCLGGGAGRAEYWYW